MELNTDQRAAVDACGQAIRDRQPVTRLFGYAGTGKTTIASTVVEEAGLDMYRVQFAAPTGKAAAVLARKPERIRRRARPSTASCISRRRRSRHAGNAGQRILPMRESASTAASLSFLGLDVTSFGGRWMMLKHMQL